MSHRRIQDSFAANLNTEIFKLVNNGATPADIVEFVCKKTEPVPIPESDFRPVFLPYAFTGTLEERSIFCFFRKFVPSSVIRFYDEYGVMTGSGQINIHHKNLDQCVEYSSGEVWQGKRISVLPIGLPPDDDVQLFISKIPENADIKELKNSLKSAFSSSMVRTFHSHDGTFIGKVLVTMPYKMAEKLAQASFYFIDNVEYAIEVHQIEM